MPEKVCQCCKKPVPDLLPEDVAVAFHDTLRQNDIREVFRITGDRRFIMAEDIQPQEAAQAFAQQVNVFLEGAR